MTINSISIESLIPTHHQPRTKFDQANLEGLAQSIQTHGIIQPIIVTPSTYGNYYIIVGERRWRAAKLAGLTSVPCIIRDIKEHDRLEVAIIENIQREAMSALDEANSYKRLMDEYDYTHEIIAKKLGKSRSAITNALRILDLPPIIIEDLKSGQMSAAHARALCAITDENLLHQVHKTIVEKKMSVRETESFIKNLSKNKNKYKRKVKTPAGISPDVNHMLTFLQDRFGGRVVITGNSEQGVFEFSYSSRKVLEEFLDVIFKNSFEKS